MKWHVIIRERPWVNRLNLKVIHERTCEQGRSGERWAAILQGSTRHTLPLMLWIFDDGDMTVVSEVSVTVGTSEKESRIYVDFHDSKAFMSLFGE